MVKPQNRWNYQNANSYLIFKLQAFILDVREINFSSLKLTSRNNCFDRIQSILVNTNIEKPPNSFLADRLDGFSISIKNIFCSS